MRSFAVKFTNLILAAALLCLQGARINAQMVRATLATAANNAVDQKEQASSALQQGRRLLKRGQSDQALDYLQTALKLYTEAKDNRGAAAAHNELGDLYLRQGQYTVALDQYKSAFDGFLGVMKKQDVVTKAIGVEADRFNANLMLAKIGDANYRLGRIAEAAAAYGQMQVKKPEGAVSKAARRFGGLGGIVGGLSTGRVEIEAPTSAAIIALEAKKEFDLYRVGIVYATHELGAGRLDFLNNSLDSAKKHFENALEAAGASLASLAKLGQTQRFRAAARTSLGDVELRQGHYKDAGKLYSDAAKGAKEDKRLDLTWPAQRGMARSQWLQAAQENNPKKAASLRESALAGYREAIGTIETLRQGSIRADESRTTFLASTKDVFDEAATSLAEMAILSAPAAGAPLEGKALEYASEAFKITELARARSLLDLLGETNSQITEGVPADLLKRKQENLDRQQDIAQQLTGLVIAADQQKKKLSDLDNELDKLQVEYDDLENKIRTASPRYLALTGGQPLALGEVQQKVLDDQTVLLEYSLGNEASYLWAVTRTGAALYKLPRRSALDKLATDLRAQLIPSRLQRRIVGIDVAADQTRGFGVASAAEEAALFVVAATALYKATVEPAASLIGQKRLLIVADGALNYIPFEALVRSSDAVDYSTLNYLVKTNEIVYAPSASVIAAIRQQPNRATNYAMLLVADPIFNSSDSRAHDTSPTESSGTRGLGLDSALADVAGQAAAASASSASGPMRGLPLARLNGTRTEAEQIAKIAQTSGGRADVWLDLNASEENVETGDIAKYRFLHIATHGLLDAQRPQFTGLVLSLIGNKKADGFLRTDEVFNLRLGTPLVMLSACETGLGKERRGEGVMGLTRAFMYAGAPTVGVTLWSVADKSTADLMTDFYKRLFASAAASPSGAMHDAQLAMISGKKYSAPFYWAPFILVGDWR